MPTEESGIDLLALYGAVLATIVFVWNVVRTLRDRRPRLAAGNLRIEDRGPMVSFGAMSSRVVIESVAVDLTNIGSLPFTIRSVAIEEPVPHAARFVPLATTGEPLIVPGASREYDTAASNLDAAEGLRLRVVLSDGTVFRSEPFALAPSRAEGPPGLSLRREWSKAR